MSTVSADAKHKYGKRDISFGMASSKYTIALQRRAKEILDRTYHFPRHIKHHDVGSILVPHIHDFVFCLSLTFIFPDNIYRIALISLAKMKG